MAAPMTRPITGRVRLELREIADLINLLDECASQSSEPEASRWRATLIKFQAAGKRLDQMIDGDCR